MTARLDVRIRKTLAAQGRRVELDVAFATDADRIVLYGPSGAGKTLTLHVVAGLVAADAARIAFAGEVWCDTAAGIALPARARRVGLVFQDYALFPHLTVEDNVAAAQRRLLPRRRTAAEREIVETLLETYGLTRLRGSYPAQLSGGERQRTALARALASRPRLLLLDEPFAALDEPLRARARADLLAAQARHGLPIVLITHDPRDRDAFAQHVVNLDGGHVAGDAVPAAAVRSSAA